MLLHIGLNSTIKSLYRSEYSEGLAKTREVRQMMNVRFTFSTDFEGYSLRFSMALRIAAYAEFEYGSLETSMSVGKAAANVVWALMARLNSRCMRLSFSTLFDSYGTSCVAMIPA